MNTCNIRDLTASYYVFQMNYLGFLVFIFVNNLLFSHKQIIKLKFVSKLIVINNKLVGIIEKSTYDKPWSYKLPSLSYMQH